MSVNIISAISKNRVIGKKVNLPWNIPLELKYFKKLTSGKGNVLLMGRNTWKSLPTYPEPLSNRDSYVITKTTGGFEPLPPITYTHLPNHEDIIKIQKIYPNIWICGGQSIYEYYIDKPYIDKLYLTEINDYVDGDAYFPEIPKSFCKVIQGQPHAVKINTLKYVNYNFNVYNNLSYPRWGRTYFKS